MKLKKGIKMFSSYVKYVSIIGISGLLLNGCASKYPITYNSNPTGASVVCNGINKGYTPTTYITNQIQSKRKVVT